MSILAINIALVRASEISMSIDRTTARVGEQLSLDVSVTSDGQSAPGVLMDNKDGLVFYQTNFTSTSMSMVNFKMSISKVSRFIVIPKKEGEFDIDNVYIEEGGKRIYADPIKINIGQAQGQLPSQPQQATQEDIDQSFGRETPEIFVNAELNKTECFVGEQLLITYTIYTQKEIKGLDFQPINFTGMVKEDIPIPQINTRQVTLGNKKYLAAKIKELLLFPISSAESIDIPYANVVCTVIERTNRRSSPFNDPFFDFDTFFDGGVRRNVTVTSNPLTIKVKELPSEGRPANFAGAVGTYHISSSVDKTSANQGDAVTFTINLEGRGNIKNAPKPTLPTLDNIDVYDSKRDERIGLDGQNLSGNIRYEYVLVPKKAGQIQIPSLEYPYFDPESAEYLTAKSNPINLEIMPSTRTDDDRIIVSGGESKREIVLTGEDFRYIQTNIKLKNVNLDFYKSFSFIFLHLLSISVVICTVIYKSYQTRLSADIKFARRRRAPKIIKKHLKQAENCLAQNKSSEFYAALSNGLLSYLSDKLTANLQGMTTESISSYLIDKGFQIDTVNKLISILNEFDEARFSPVSADKETMANHFEIAKQIAMLLDKVKI